ncbi:MAG: hypothetical protein LBC51_08800 [Treponema sp.]|nr:hypothetical protein [Treponema sp.]
MRNRILFAQARIVEDPLVERKPQLQPQAGRIEPEPRHSEKSYTLEEARKSLLQGIETIEQAIAKLPAGACPGDYVVLVLVLREAAGSTDVLAPCLPHVRVLGSRPSRLGPGPALRGQERQLLYGHAKAGSPGAGCKGTDRKP